MKQHKFICGMTQAGKTRLAIYFYERAQHLAIFFNTNNIYELHKKSDITAVSIPQIADAINNKARKINFIPNQESDELARLQLIELKKLLFKIGEQICLKDESVAWCELYVDEVQDFFDKMDSDTNLQGLWKKSLRWGIEVTAISQRPADVSHTVLTQSDIHYIFKLKNYDIPYYQRYKIPVEENLKWINQQYHFLRFDGENIQKIKPIKPE